MPRVGMRPVVVFSKGKPDMTYTAEWFKRHAFDSSRVCYVVSEGDDVAGYQRSTGCRVIVAKGSRNLASKRQWALDYFTTPSEPWLLFFEDNIMRVTGVLPSHYGMEEIDPTTRHIYHSLEYSPQDVLRCMMADIHRMAEPLGAFYGGYACNDNHFYRSRKYRTIAFVWTKMGYVRRGGPCWPEYLNEMDDYGMTAECLLHSGRTVVNNYLYPWAKRYEGRGGSRTIGERADDKRAAVAEMMRRFPDLFRIRDKKGCPTGTEIQLRFNSDKQVTEWRQRIMAGAAK